MHPTIYFHLFYSIKRQFTNNPTITIVKLKMIGLVIEAMLFILS
jgi:hypothetical protein